MGCSIAQCAAGSLVCSGVCCRIGSGVAVHAAALARIAIDRILAHREGRLDAHTVLNVNIPRTETDDAPMPPIRVVEMNTAPSVDAYERRESPAGHVYYWLGGTGMEFTHTAPDTDVEALGERCVTVTPLTYVMTDHARLQTWKELAQG